MNIRGETISFVAPPHREEEQLVFDDGTFCAGTSKRIPRITIFKNLSWPGGLLGIRMAKGEECSYGVAMVTDALEHDVDEHVLETDNELSFTSDVSRRYKRL